MTSRLREDERNERLIRSLLKLPENRRCINCNSLVPQYVCTNFWTFVCTTCSGIHREFTHRVKSVSMAKFTSEEVSALQGGGNASAKEIYFKEWDSHRQSYPDSSNVERLRDFIKHVYVDRRYTGGRRLEKPPTLKMSRFQGYVIQGEAENQGGSKSPSFKPTAGGKSDDRGSKNNEDERQSPVYNQEFGRSPAERTDTVDDWRREDRFKVEFQSPDRPRDPEMLGSPIVRPVRDILGDNSSPLRVIKPPKVNGLRPLDNKTVSSTSLASSSGNPTEKRTEGSLIDFNSAPDPSSATVQHTAPSAPVVAQPTTTLNDNWANFDSVQEVKTSDALSNTDFLDVLSELSVPSSSLGATTVSAPISQSSVAYGGAHAESQGIDIKQNAKKELPVDLFSSNYSSFAARPPGWFQGPQYGMGYNMQYNVQMPMPPAYMQPSSAQAITFPSMAPLQGALPNMLPQQGIQRTATLGEWLPTQPSHPLSYSNIQHTSSLGTPFSAWMPTQSTHPVSKSPQILSYGSAIPSGPFIGQVPPNIQPFRPHASGVGVDNSSSVSFNYSQQQQHGSTFSSAAGNPFGRI